MKVLQTHDQYETIEELISDLGIPTEVEFGYAGKKYTITPEQNGFFISEWYKEEETGKEFSTIDTLLDGYVIAGKKLRDIATEIEVYSH